jgi:hypothetical protein
MSYREHAPPPALAPWLACTWERHALDGVTTRVLPDGCIDVIWIEGAGTQVVGANTTAFLVSLAPGCTSSERGCDPARRRRCWG